MIWLRYILAATVLLGCLRLHSQTVVINELLAANDNSVTDEDGDSSDWIELYNSTASTVNLQGWQLSDDPANPAKWTFPAIAIAPGNFLLLFASGKDRSSGPFLHTNFKISADGEEVLLTNNLGMLQNLFPATVLSADISLGSRTDGSAALVQFSGATPGSSNNGSTVLPVVTDTLTFSVPSGFYAQPFTLSINSTYSLTEIRYTLDGNAPSPTSLLYTGEMAIKSRKGQADVISRISTSEAWKAPATESFKGTVLKAAAFSHGIQASEVVSGVWFVDPDIASRYAGVPIISLITAPANLFDEKAGIYVPGLDEENNNYNQSGKEWERMADLQFFDQSHALIFEQGVGIRIHGHATRGNPQKSLRLYARQSYGAEYFDYPFFESKDISRFKRLLLRTPSADRFGSMMKDPLASSLIQNLDMEYQAFQPCILFINGEYWGIQPIRERIDKHFLAANQSVHPDSVEILVQNHQIEQGSEAHFRMVKEYIATHSVSEPEVWAQIENWIDIPNFIDYQITQLYLANFDWPQHNIRFWRPTQEGGKWRWIYYDGDRSFTLASYSQLGQYSQQTTVYEPDKADWAIFLLRALLQNDGFRERFISRFFHLLNTNFRADVVIAAIDKIHAAYTPLVPEHINRWNDPQSVNLWNEQVQELKSFALKRPAEMTEQILEHLGKPFKIYPNPASTAHETVTIEMKYSDGVDVQLTVFTLSGQVVQQFTPETSSGNPTLRISDLPGGIYLVRIDYGTSVQVEKLVVIEQ